MADSHAVAEKLAGLASRVNNLAVDSTGDDSRTLTMQQIQLNNLANQAIAMDLDNSTGSYSDAVNSLDAATKSADAAIAKIGDVQKVIADVASAVGVVGKLLGT